MVADAVTGEKPQAQGGFTMIEVLISLVLTALAVMGISALYITQTRATGFSHHSSEASVLAENKVETLRTAGAAATQSGSDTMPVNSQGSAGGIYTRQWTETVGPSFADIVVTVTWTDDGYAHTVTARGRRNL